MSPSPSKERGKVEETIDHPEERLDFDSGASVIVKKGLRLREPARRPLFVP